MDNPVRKLTTIGQSIWLDNINRAMIDAGALEQMIAQGLRGVTSNPSIFNNAISASNAYDQGISELFSQDKSAFEIYDDLTTRDIRDAADIFLPVYRESGGLDGYISLEVNPRIAYRVDESIAEALRLYQKVGRPNLMLKIPATKEGFRVSEELISQGVNVNVTLIFSLGQYIETFQAYVNGMKRFLGKGGQARNVRSVASVFVSRIDTVVDKALDGLLKEEQGREKRDYISSLKGKAAVANCGRIYAKFRELIATKEFADLQKKGVQPQRVLWASTSTKNPEYSDIKYVSELIAQDTVNTIPEATFFAFLDHGQAKEACSGDSRFAQEVIARLSGLGIDIDAVCARLCIDGVQTFEKAFDALLKSIEEKAASLCKK